MVRTGRTSIVIPAYQEAPRLRSSMPRLATEMSARDDVEVVLVDDGSTDETSEVARQALGDLPRVTVVRLPWNAGKGSAVRAGVAAATGECVVFVDADSSPDPAELPRLVAALDDADIAVGRRPAGEDGAHRTWFRRHASRAYRTMARRMVGVAASDPQCGMKAFRSQAAKVLFHLARTDGYAFDAEVLGLAQLLGYRVVEVPVSWTETEGSHVRPVADPALMFRDLVLIRFRLRRARRRLAATR
jgi:glycosyltransferase involved in cell wall biosynthesis